jgi:Cysteine-rich secretory protein family
MPVEFGVRSQQADLCAVRWFAVLLGVVAVFLGPLAVVHAQQPANYAERALFDAANRERIALGLQPLRWDDALANAARDHAIRMAQRNALSHQFPGELPVPDRARMAGARYTTIAENVAEGPSPDIIHASWMHSPPHRANLLAPELNSVGIAVVSTAPRTTPNGGVAAAALFAVEDFSQSVVNLNYQEQERQVGAVLESRGLQISGSADDARRTCATDRGWTGSSRPALVVRFEAADLRRLPDDLEQRIQAGHYRAATVGACDAGSSRGFTRFRVAVLLF